MYVNRKILHRILDLSLILWLVLIPVFWHLDLSRGVSGYYDVLSMAPYSFIHLVIFYVLGGLSLYFGGPSLFRLSALAFYFPLIQLANYPSLTIRDVYLHAAPVRTILENGHIVYPSDPAPSSWPSAFYIHGMLTTILGCDLVVANYILYFTLILTLTAVLFVLAEYFVNKGYSYARLGPLLFLPLFFNYLFDNFHHFSRTALAFVLLFSFLYAFATLRDRRGLLVQIAFLMAIIITHPFQSLALAVFLVAFTITAERVKTFGLTVLTTIAFAGWIFFQGSSTFLEAVLRLKTFFSVEYVKPIIETLPVKESIPLWGSLLRNYFRYSFLGLFGIAALLSGFAVYTIKRKKHDFVLAFMVSLFLSSAAVLFALLLLPDWQIPRFTPFAALAIAFLPVLVLGLKLSQYTSRLSRLTSERMPSAKRLIAVVLIFTVSLSGAVMALRFERNYYFGEVNHQPEHASLSFFFAHKSNSTSTAISWRTEIYSLLYNYKSTHKILRIWYLDLKNIGGNASLISLELTRLINKSDFVIEGMRDSYTLGDNGDSALRIVSSQVIDPQFAQIYSNGYYVLQARFVPKRP